MKTRITIENRTDLPMETVLGFAALHWNSIGHGGTKTLEATYGSGPHNARWRLTRRDNPKVDTIIVERA